MKNVILSAVFLLTAWLGQEVYAQQGFGTNQPDKSAAVDIVSTKRGLLIPRIALTGTNDNSTISDPHNSLFVYNTATAGTSGNEVTPGYYYFEVTGFDPANTATNHGTGKWVRFISADDVKTVKVAEGENVKIDSVFSADGKTAYYNVSVKGATGPGADGKVLVTKVT